MLSFVLRDVMRTAHVLAGGVWVGGSVVYLCVILPALRVGGAAPAVGAQIATLFRQLVNACMGVLLISGVYLTFDRLSAATVGTAYVIVLVVKIVAALAMMALALLQAQEARRLARRRGRLWKVAPLWILGLGVLTFLLGATLTGMFEAGQAF
jgi:uncharacterized membrane protein